MADQKKLLNRLTNKALKLLSYRPRSIHEIKTRLQRLPASPELIQQVIDNLIDQDLLNDQTFASWWVEQRTISNPKGNLAIQSELKQKGLDRSLIQSILLDRQQELELAKTVALKKLSTITHLPLLTQKQKLITLLRTRGFSFATIYSVIDDLLSKA